MYAGSVPAPLGSDVEVSTVLPCGTNDMLMPVHVIEPLPVACSVIPPALETVEPSAGSAPAYTRSAGGGGGGTGVGVGSGAGTGVLVASIVIEPVVVALNVFEATPLEAVASSPPVNVPFPVEPPLRAKWTTVLLSLVTTLPAASRISTVSVRDVPVTRSEVALVKVRWSAAPWTIVKVVVPLVSEVALAVIVIEPASAPVTVFVATPLEAVAEPSPVTVPAPLVFANVTEVELSPVSRLPPASRTSTVRSRVAPEVRSEVGLVNVRWSAGPTTTVNVVESPVRPPAVAPIVIEPASAPVTVFVAMPAEAVAEPSPVTVPMPAVLAKVTLVVLSPVRRLPAASRTSTVRSRVEPDARFEVALVKVRWSAAPATIVNVVVPLVSEVALAVIVIEPASAPVTCLVAMPLAAVAEPTPVTVPVPAVLAKVTLVVLSPVTRLPAASRTSAVRSRVEPDARFEVALVNVR